jgi:hypothetical protein
VDGDVVVYRPREVRFRVPSYYGPWGLSALGDRERAKYVRNELPYSRTPARLSVVLLGHSKRA